MVETKGWRKSVRARCVYVDKSTYDLELDRNETEVNDLHCWPDQEVGFERWDIDVLELARHGAFSTTFRNGHECEKACQT
jgi:hypothetical protein